MRLYRGLDEPYKPESVCEAGKALHDGTNFTDCPYAALCYARSGRGVLLVIEVPPELEPKVREEVWLGEFAKRFIIWGRFDALIVATFPAKELRAELKSKRMMRSSVKDPARSATLRHLIGQRLATTARA